MQGAVVNVIPRFSLRALVITLPALVALGSVIGSEILRNLDAYGFLAQAALGMAGVTAAFLTPIWIGGYIGFRLARAFHLSDDVESTVVLTGAFVGVFFLPLVMPLVISRTVALP
jgi:hypothetical protein